MGSKIKTSRVVGVGRRVALGMAGLGGPRYPGPHHNRAASAAS